MLAPLGHLLTLFGLAAAICGASLAFYVARAPHPTGLSLLERLCAAFFCAMLAAAGVMLFALVTHDFSVSYVAQVGSLATPLWVTIVSLWSSLEGSILLWGVILGATLVLLARATRQHPEDLRAYTLGVAFVVASFFALMLCGPANPFTRILQPAADGPGPNPLLQNHVLMAIHPPMLYLGYVGMTAPFAMGMAALIAGRMPAGWLSTLRLTMLWPWTFLSVGIVLGSWWAYEVLGWGGFWAWDPVENASFLPWLTATGFLHATVVQQRRKLFHTWTLSLVLITFLLTLLGTFMTRSGVFNSVHSFTQSPIGPLFLIALGVALVASVGLLAGRGHLLESRDTTLHPLSREVAFLLNNLALTALTFTVLLGTTFPLLVEGLTDTKLSVGEPYYDRMAAPLGMALVFLMGVGPQLPWGRARSGALVKRLVWPVALGLATLMVLSVLGLGGWLTRLTFGLCAFAAYTSLHELIAPALHRVRRHRESLWVAQRESVRQQPRRIGGALVHLAILVIAAGICGAQSFRTSAEAQLSRGETLTLGHYTLRYQGASADETPHLFSAIAHLQLSEEGRVLGQLVPRLNFYPNQREPIGTPHVVTLGSRDVYASLLSVAPNGEHVVVKLFVIPMVSWLWRSLPLLVLGSLVSLWPRRGQEAL